MKYLILMFVSLTAACGFNGTQKLETNNAEQSVVQSGSSYAYVIVRLEFIQQIHDLCRDKYLVSDYETEALYRQVVAECVFDNLAILNISPTFQNSYCEPGADLSGFTPEQTSDILAACAALGS